MEPTREPGDAGSFVRFEDAITSQQRGDIARAEAICRELLRIQPLHADAWHLRGLLAFQARRFEQGVEFIRQSLASNARQPAAHANIGVALLELRRPDEALVHFDQALVLQAGSAETFYGRGTALLALGRYEQALGDFDRALSLIPDLVPALTGRGQTLQRLERLDEALACLERALQLAPRDADALYSCGNVLFELGRYEDALETYDAASNAGMEAVELLNNRGNALRELGRYEEALRSYQRATELEPACPETLNNRGNVLLDLQQLPQALACYDAALRARPDFADALDNRGLALLMADQPGEAARSYEQLVQRAPHLKMARSSLLNARSMCCDWRCYEDDHAAVIDFVEAGQLVHPFPFLAVSGSAALQLQCARRFAAQKWPSAGARTRTLAPLWSGERYRHERVKVAYVSGDLRHHAVSLLMAGVFERHDRAEFETIAIALRPDDHTPTGRRVRAAFTQFIDVTRKSDREVASLLRELEVDIAVDLMGFTRWSRPGIFAQRPAPVQVSYLGFPGTLGTPYMDYILADELVIPHEAAAHYVERVVYLPECYQANDDRCTIGAKPTRKAAGLPDQGVVFCCFNNTYKLNPPVFDVWMRLLREVPGSVLWLVADADEARRNLSREAAARGVDEPRLVFASRLPYPEHLGRLGLADLFLDTLPYNAGTTASDALRAGVPVLTCAGEAFASRMASSLLQTVGLPELITHSLEDYERKALELAREPDLLAALRARLAENLNSSPLFDTERFTRHLEAAYRAMHERVVNGEGPVSFRVAPLARPSRHAA